MLNQDLTVHVIEEQAPWKAVGDPRIDANVSFKYHSVSPQIVNRNVRLAKLRARGGWRSVKAFNEFIVETTGIRMEGERIAIIVPRSPISEIYRTDFGKARDVLNFASLYVATR